MFKFLIKFLNTQISGEWDELCQVFLKGTPPPFCVTVINKLHHGKSFFVVNHHFYVKKEEIKKYRPK